MNSLKFIFVVWIYSINTIILPLQSQEPYNPITSDSIPERWRWHVFDPLKDNYIFCGTELENGKLLFISDQSLILYDGYQKTEIPFPDEFKNIQTLDVFVEKERVYLNTSIGLITFYNGEWEKILSYLHNYPQARQLFAKNKEGLLITGGAGALYQLEENKATLLAPVEYGVGMITHTNDRLFLTPALSDSVYSCDFSSSKIKDQKNWNSHDFSSDAEQSPFLIKNDKTGDVFALTLSRYNRIFKYSSEEQSWNLYEHQIPDRDNRIVSGISFANSSLLIFSKSSTYYLNNGKWIEFDRFTYHQPINSVFAFQKENQNLIIGGRGEHTIEIDLTDKVWKTYPDLHFYCEDFDNRKWFLSKNGDVISLNVRSNNWVKYTQNVIDTPSVAFCSKDGYIWLAGSHNGVAAISRFDGFNWTIKMHPQIGSQISHLSVKQLRDGRIIFGSGEEFRSDQQGMLIYEKKEKDYTFQSYGPPVSPARIASITETPNGMLWAGGNEIYQIDGNLQKPFETVQELQSDWVDYVHTLETGEVIAAIGEKGLFKFSESGWQLLDAFQASSDWNLASYILQDRKRKDTIWVATDNGITRLDKNDFVHKTLPEELGMLREEGTLTQSQDGSIWVNKTNRAWYFAHKNERMSAVKNFKTVRYTPSKGKPQVKIIDYDSKSNAPANIHVKWEGVDLWSETSSNKLRYSYQINNEQWSDYSNETETMFLRYPRGTHQFNVKVKDLDGNTSTLDKPLSIVVNPPIWKQPWFVLGGLLMLVITCSLIVLLFKQRLKHVLQLDELKLQFFTNMSHELRTPLMLIIGPLETLLEQLPKDFDKTQAKIAHRNSKKMLHLVDQILEFRKIEYGALDSRLIHQDLIKDIKNVIDLHTPLAEEKSIDIVTSFTQEHFETTYDADKIDRILSNLISNAIKYTPENGTILIKTRTVESENEDKILFNITIEDDGEGIELDKQNHIFEPFYRVPGNTGKKARGVGLGLSLVKNLLDSIDGSIIVESPVRIEQGVSKGTRFDIKIPITSESSTTQPSTSEDEIIPIEHNSDEKWVLIVEDDDEIREYMGSELMKDFSIVYAENGIEGLKKAKSIIPDLILTDVLMPEMDGNQLCERIRANESTSHIPIIALTALKSSEHELNALTKGADDFLTKPVSIKILRQKIFNAIKSRDLLQNNYKKSVKQLKESPNLSIKGSVDDKFIEKVKNLVEKHLEDPFFDVEKLSAILGMSRMTLYRKIKAITGDSPSELVRITRLKVAAKLLLKGDLNISEIADQTGYQDLSHFSGSFKKYYDCSPSQYIRNNRSN